MKKIIHIELNSLRFGKRFSIKKYPSLDREEKVRDEFSKAAEDFLERLNEIAESLRDK